jgi:hypothetical protein
MESKVCKKCLLTKNVTEFYSSKNECKVCYLADKKAKYDPVKEKEKNHINYQKHKEKRIEQQKEYVKRNFTKTQEYKKKWVEEKKEHLKEYRKKYNEINKEVIWEKTKLRLNNDPLYAFKVAMRKSILKAFRKRGFNKNSSTQIILGCTFEEFMVYLESKFEPWMNWDNRGLYNGEPNYGWDIDHIIPLSSVNTIEDIVKLNHYTNLQPLCSYINRDVKIDNF